MWRVIGASVIGTSHQQQQTPCQDFVMFKTLSGHSLLAVIADGAGSVSHGGDGAKIACQVTSQYLEQAFNQQQQIDVELVQKAIIHAHQQLIQVAKKNTLTQSDYACTLLGILATPTHAFAFQIGDGAIIVNSCGVQGVVFWPDNGLYANMTYFLTDEDYLQHIHVVQINTPLEEVILLTDGLQRLALVLDSKIAHEPFFSPIFKALRANNANTELLNQHLAQFLASQVVNQRTDDDKTLVMAIRE